MGMLPDHEKAVGLSPDQANAIRTELNAILRSSYFSGSKRCQDFLELIVHQALDGNCDYLTERFLGAELFGRPINYETGTDSIVRVRANDVRRRLAQYYADGHGGSKVLIELVSGNYVPEFHWREPKITSAESATASLPEQTMRPNAPPEASALHLPEPVFAAQAKSRRNWAFASLIVGAVALGTCAGWLMRERTLNRILYPLQYEPSLNALWTPLINSTRETDIVLSDASFQLLEDIEKRPYSLNDYLNRTYIDQTQTKIQTPEMQFVLTQIASKNFGNSSEFRLAQRMTALDPGGNRMHVYNARDYSSALAAQDNVVLVGSQYTNPWQQLFGARLNFRENAPSVNPGVVVNSSPRPGEQAVYSPSGTVGYCVVAYLPNPDRGTQALLIEGTSSEATEAGGDFLLSEDEFSGLEKILRSSGMPYFEVLLKTSQVRGTPITATLETYRTYPGQP